MLPQPLTLSRREVDRLRLVEENLLLKSELADRLAFPRILGRSPALAEATRQLREGARTDATILIDGETGTGKSLFARAVHHLSARQDAPFVAVRCAASPEIALERELFGFEGRQGRVELVDRGTLFLDEIGAAGPKVQARLLRVLEGTLGVHVRVVAATSRDLRRRVAEGTFLDDLYFRLSEVTITAPPLRTRDGDVALLAAHLLEKHRRELGRDALRFSEESLDLMRAYAWPGNVRELDNCVERAVILADGDRIEPRHLALGPARQRGSAPLS